MRRRRILVLTRTDLVPPDSLEGLSEKQISLIKTDYDVVLELRELGHEVRVVGVEHELEPLTGAIEDWRPHIVFNLLEEFDASQERMALLLGYLELIRLPYTGCGPIGMLFSTNKALQRKILRHHRIRVPEFAIYRMGRAIKRPARLEYPLIVKSLTAHGSAGISQASIVSDDESLVRRVEYVHRTLETDAIAEQYIEGREFYVGVIGNRRLQALPVWELSFENLPAGAPRIATERVKWDIEYQDRSGVMTRAANDLSPALSQRIAHLCKRAYRALNQTGYARMDLRMTDDERIWLIESNPNPHLAHDEDFAKSAHAAGIDYDRLLGRIVSLGLRRAED